MTGGMTGGEKKLAQENTGKHEEARGSAGKHEEARGSTGSAGKHRRRAQARAQARRGGKKMTGEKKNDGGNQTHRAGTHCGTARVGAVESFIEHCVEAGTRRSCGTCAAACGACGACGENTVSYLFLF
jgi:hypothetical protein